MNHIPLLDLKAEYLHMKQDIDAAIQRCLEHQQWVLGPEVKELEDRVADYIGVKTCIGTSSGTEALVLALRALALKTKGQEYFDRSDLIITTPFTFTATGDAILRAGATPVFVDIDPVTYNIDPARIRDALEAKPFSPSPLAISHARFAGILPVHLYGRPCEMDETMSIADEHGLWVVEDVAQAFGAEWQGVNGKRQKVGSIGDLGCLSFFPSKNLGGYGDGGMVATNDDHLSSIIRMLLKHGGKDKYNVEHIGYNARLDTLQAGILLAKLKYIDEFNSRRRTLAEGYIRGLSAIPHLVLPLALSHSPLAASHCFHQFTIRVLDGLRDSLQAHLKSDGIDSMVYYPVPLHKMKVFEGRSLIASDLEHAEKAAKEVLSLPINPLQEQAGTERVINSVRIFSTATP